MYPEQTPQTPQAPNQPPAGPQVYSQQPAVYPAGVGPAPNQTVVAGTPQSQPTKPGGRKSPKKLIIISAVVFVVLLAGVVTVLALASKPAPKKTSTKTTTTNQAGPSPATALSVQQGSDGISQYLNGLDDNADFPTASPLSDQALHLN